MKISELTASTKKVNITGTIAEIDKEPTRLEGGYIKREATLQDNTGSIMLVLWDQDVNKIKVGDTVTIENGYTKTYRNKLQVSKGKYGTLTIVGHEESTTPQPEPQRLSGSVLQDVISGLRSYAKEFREKAESFEQMANDLESVKH